MRHFIGNKHCLVFLFIFAFIDANELTHCCTNGKKHFEHSPTCAKIKLKETEGTCALTASICCMRALLDHNCEHGIKVAKEESSCSSNTNRTGGGIHKECCECCLLAKELLRKGESCTTAPDGFSAPCLHSFHLCCSKEPEDDNDLQYHRYESHPDSVGLLSVGDRCASAKCEHACTDRGGTTVECSCRPGYELGSDGYSCIDTTAVGRRELRKGMEEFRSSTSSCCPTSERCEYTTDEGRRCMTEDRYLSDSTMNPHNPMEMKTGHVSKPVHQATLDENEIEKGCSDGWELSPSGQCIDVDECNLGSHDCGPLYQCRNTQGSYRCDPKKCAEGELMNPRTGECTSIDCPIGYKPIRGRCEDVNECETLGRCRQFEECINTPGSFRCQERGNLCAKGYRMDRDTGFCVDINECTDGTHLCGDKQCINLVGSYKCRCSAGFEFNETTKRCEDVDECKKFAGHVCSLHATCENTFGSFKCHCKNGFTIAKDARNCDDIDECSTGMAHCAQKCINIPGSYQCICERGYRLGPDGVTCEDIDECTLWAGSGDDLCMGGCINTPGSYKCHCPAGYEIQDDGRTCKDIDECAKGECQGNDQICVNTLGSFKCHIIRCPPNYVHDKNYKNVVDDGYSCLKQCRPSDPVCISNHTREILYQFRGLPSTKYIRDPIEVSRVRTHMDMPFSVEYRMDRTNRDTFMVQQDRNIGIVKMIAPVEGPTTVLVRLHINTFSRSHVLLAHNVALITVYISPYDF